MKYHKIINMLDNTPDRKSKIRKKNWVEINDDACGMHDTNNQTKPKNSMLKSKRK